MLPGMVEERTAGTVGEVGEVGGVRIKRTANGSRKPGVWASHMPKATPVSESESLAAGPAAATIPENDLGVSQRSRPKIPWRAVKEAITKGRRELGGPDSDFGPFERFRAIRDALYDEAERR